MGLCHAFEDQYRRHHKSPLRYVEDIRAAAHPAPRDVIAEQASWDEAERVRPGSIDREMERRLLGWNHDHPSLPKAG